MTIEEAYPLLKEAFTEYTNMISDLKNKYAHSEG